MATPQDDLINKSARKEEIQARANQGGGVFRFYFAPGILSSPLLSLPIDPPGYWSPSRDRTLLQAYRRCGLWASAVNIAVTRLSSTGYEVKGGVPLRVREARKMLGRDYVGLMQRLTRDYVTYDNGAFMQIVHATSGYGSKVMGFMYLPGSRCVRTGDPDRPVVYMDEIGYLHELRAHEVVAFSDMPDEDLLGVGLCATSRAYDAIYEHLSVRQFFKEKATGRRPLALDFITGISQEAVDDTIAGAKLDASAQGMQAYMGTALTANANNVPLNHVRIPLADLPAGFDQQKHTELVQVEFAAALGIDPSDLNPALIGNRQLGAGTQSQVLDDKQDSKGLVSLRQQLLGFWNDTEQWSALPNSVTFAFSENDIRDQQAQAALAQTRASTRASQILSGEITPLEARQLAVDDGDLPASFVTVDQTSEESLTDEDKAAEDSSTDEAGNPVQRLSVSQATALIPSELRTPTPTTGGPVTQAAQPGQPAPAESVSTTALNGAQVSSLVDVIQSVSAGTLPPETAFEILRNAFPFISIVSLQKMIDSAKTNVIPTSVVGAQPAPVVATKELHTGAMVALMPTLDTADQIIKAVSGVDWPQGTTLTAPDELHCTLAYLGQAADIAPDEQTRMIAAAKQLSETELEAVRFNGVARFNGSDTDGDAIVILLAAPTINDMAAIARKQIGNESSHPFLAHMTLAYIPKDAPTPTVPPPFESIQMPAIAIVFADESIRFELGDTEDEMRYGTPADAAIAALKAYATTLATVTMPTTRQRTNAAHWQAVTKGFDDLGRVWTIAARQNAPQDSGDMARSIRYAVTNKDTAAVTLKLYAGNKQRPEVAIRSVLFGRKGFAAKKEGGMLRFQIGDKTIYTRAVRGAAANDWLGRSLDQIGPQLKAFSKQFVDPTVKPIEVEDIAGAVIHETAEDAPKVK